MKMRVCPENADFANQFADNHQNDGDIRGAACHVKTVLHQCADWAIVMLVEVVVMVLGNREQACYQQCDDYGLQKFHLKFQ